jgi:hypothetical protein
MNKSFWVMALCFPALIVPSLFLGAQTSAALDALVWLASVFVTGAALRFAAPRWAHAFLLLAVLGWLAFGAGLVGIVVVVFWLFSAWSLGAWVLRWAYGGITLSEISTTEALLTGVAIWLAVWGCMLHFPVNHPVVYWVLCLLACLLQARQAILLGSFWRGRWMVANDWMRSIPMWAWILGLCLIGWVLRWASFPTVGYDDHALHLRIWTELLAHQKYAFDVQTQIWSVAPFAVDLMHAGLSLMAGGDARSAMNLGLGVCLLLLMALVLSKLTLTVGVQWLLILLMASTPMLGNLLLSLQTELFLAVLALAGLRLVTASHGPWRSQHLLGVLACSALCAAVKLPGAVLGVTLLVALMTRWWSPSAVAVPSGHQLSWRGILVLIPLGFIAFHAYGLSWLLTGNPVFPLYNGIFQSPYFPPENFTDTRWVHGFSMTSYVRVFFNTSAFFESANYTAGWQYLLMLPVAILLAFRRVASGVLRVALIPLLGFGLVMFSATQYWRYVFPVMPIAGIVLASLSVTSNRGWRLIGLTLAMLCIALNVLAFLKVSWMMRSPAVTAFTSSGREVLTRQYAPVALLTQKVNQQGKGYRVLYPSSAPYGATLQGTPLYVIWYSPVRWKQFASLKDAQAIADFLAEEKVDFVITDMRHAASSDSPEALLREHLALYGSVVDQVETFVLYRRSDAATPYRTVFDLDASTLKRPAAAQLLLAPSDRGVMASEKPQVLAVVPTSGARQARYKVTLGCPTKDGFFVAQMNWNVGAPYYRLVACQDKTFSFSEAVPVPPGATQAEIYVTARDTSPVLVQHMTVEFSGAVGP